MPLTATLRLAALGLALALAGCATRPVNPPIAHTIPDGYRFESRMQRKDGHGNLLVLAFSGGGTRAAAFSYGVLEALRDLEVTAPDGRKSRALDAVDVIAGVSGGSFTALAFGLYGERLFSSYEQAFLKRDVEGELIGRMLSPGNWGALSSTGFGRSELAADFYDEILFHGATYADLEAAKGPMIIAAGTDLVSGARFYFTQTLFNILCSDLSKVRLARAAATSSAVPVIFSPVTYDNYGGSCGYTEPEWLRVVANPDHPVRPAARTMRYVEDLRAYNDGKARPYLHVVDGGVGDNLGLRGILDVLDFIEARRIAGLPTPVDGVKRMAVIVVNSMSIPSSDLDQREAAPGMLYQFLQSTSVPIDHYSFDAIETMRDTAARWKLFQTLRDSGALRDPADPRFVQIERAPDTELYVVDVSFDKVKDPAERAALNELPTSFALSAKAVDELRASARAVLLASPDFQRFLRDASYRPVQPAP